MVDYRCSCPWCRLKTRDGTALDRRLPGTRVCISTYGYTRWARRKAAWPAGWTTSGMRAEPVSMSQVWLLTTASPPVDSPWPLESCGSGSCHVIWNIAAGRGIRGIESCYPVKIQNRTVRRNCNSIHGEQNISRISGEKISR